MNESEVAKIKSIVLKLEHDFNKPLNNFKMLAQILPLKANDPEFIKQSIGQIEESMKKPLQILTELKELLKLD